MRKTFHFNCQPKNTFVHKAATSMSDKPLFLCPVIFKRVQIQKQSSFHFNKGKQPDPHHGKKDKLEKKCPPQVQQNIKAKTNDQHVMNCKEEKTNFRTITLKNKKIDNKVETKSAKQSPFIFNPLTKSSKKLQKREEEESATSQNEKSDFGSKPLNPKENQMPSIEEIYSPKGIMRNLAEPDFDMWRLSQDSMVDHIEYMYHDLGVAKAWKISRTTLRLFLLAVRENYQDNPYHNFQHCFCVTQMAYSMMCKLRLRNLVTVDQMGALLTAAVCHDVDHPGLNNSYHCHARTPLAILYNYKSILEQHHFAVTCRILSDSKKNIFRNVNNRDEVLTNVGDLILATDLARHKSIIEDYTSSLASGFDFKNSGHVMALLKIIIKCADVSNEVRPETVAGPWVERLFAEYYEQSAKEKKERLPITPYMDPDMVNVSESQEAFIRGILLPMFTQLSKLAVEAKTHYVNPLRETLARYEVQNTEARNL